MFWYFTAYTAKKFSFLIFSTSIKCASYFLYQNIILLKISTSSTDILKHSVKILKKEEKTVDYIMKYWQRQFKKKKIIEPEESIKYIVAHVLQISQARILFKMKEKKLNEEQLQRIEQLCECRILRMPVQYIIGKWNFRNITLKLEPPIFIPRPETEILVDVTLQKMRNFSHKECNVLEIGCGSGAICLSILYNNKHVNIIAIEENSHACSLTKRNAQDLQIENRLILLKAVLNSYGIIEIAENYFLKQIVRFNNDQFHIIVSNPPYISTKTIFKLQPEINLYEDIKALDGGKYGLKLILPILKFASQALKLKGSLILEVDSRHPPLIEMFIKHNYANKLKLRQVYTDFGNNDRIIEIIKIA